MSRKGQILGTINESLLVLIIVNCSMMFLAFLAGVTAKNHYTGYSLAEDFLGSYVVFEEKTVSVSELIQRFCDKDGIVKIDPILKKQFTEEYGQTDSYAIIVDGEIKSFTGPVSQYLEENGKIKDFGGFLRFLDKNNENVVKINQCSLVDLYVRRGVSHE